MRVRGTRQEFPDHPLISDAGEDPAEECYVRWGDPPIPISSVQPIYPDSARKAGIIGRVVLHVLVGIDGRVKDVKVFRAVRGLDGACVEAVKKWIFKPGTRYAKPVAAWVEVPFHFPP
jgi:protein TonB